MGQRMFIQSRLVPDPSMSDAELLFQLSREMERANTTQTKPNLDLGKVWVEENTVTRLGGLAFIRRRLHHHERAAERFKNLYEARYGAGNPAMDPSRIQVDTSPIAHDSGMAAKIDSTALLDRIMYGVPARGTHPAALPILSKAQIDRLVSCIILCIPCEDQVGMMPSGKPNHRQVSKRVSDLLSDLDCLSTFFGYRSEAA